MNPENNEPVPSHPSSAMVSSGGLVALLREVHCIGVSHSDALILFDDQFPDNASAFHAAFDAGKVEPGKMFTFERGPEQSPQFIINLPTKIHWKAPSKLAAIRKYIDRVVERCLLLHVDVLEISPFDDETGSVSWQEVKLEFLTSFARVPDIEVRFRPRPNYTPTKMKQVTVFTDGGAEPNPGRGGYGVVLRFGNNQKELSQGFEKTTNNRMELLAVIVALESLKESCDVRVYSDSRYVVDNISDGVLLRWRAKKWKNGKVKNIDLWERFLLAKIRHNVEMIWVKGHSGIAGNERCDQLASKAIAATNTHEVDQEYLDWQEQEAAKAAMELPIGGSKTVAKNASQQSKAKSNSKQPAVSSAHPKGKRGPKPKKIGDPCRFCATPLVRRNTKKSKKDSAYYYPWYLHCSACNRMFYIEEAKVYRTK